MVEKLLFSDLYPIFRIRSKYKDIVLKKGSKSSVYVKNVLRTLFVNFNVLFKIKRFDTLIFTSAINLSLNNQKYKDSVTSYYVDTIETSLLIIRPHKIFSKQKIWTTNFFYESLFLVFIIGITKFFKLIKKTFPFNNEIKEMNINGEEIYFRFLAEYYVFNSLIKLFNIKRIIVSSSYNYFGYIYAAKKNNVEVIELQHGLISESHMGYMYQPNEIKNFSFFPDKIFVYGKLFKEILIKKSNLFTSNQVKIIGSNALELYKTNNLTKDDEQLKRLKKQYKKIVLFTGQYTVDDKSLLLITKLQNKAPHICFLFLTRHQSEIDLYQKNFPNIIFYKGNLKFYDLVKQVDIHATVYSTTFLESLYLGVPNILFDIDNYPKKQFGEIITKGYPFILCSHSVEQIIKFIENKLLNTTTTIAKSVEPYFDNNFHVNLKTQISEFI